MSLVDIKAKLSSLSAQRDLLNTQRKTQTKSLRGLQDELIDVKTALAIVTNEGEKAQKEFGDDLSALVTSCLQIVMVENKYEFFVDFSTKRNATSVSFKLLKDGEEQEIMDGSGGTIVNLISVGLRLALHQMAVDKTRNTIIIDEGFSNLRGRDNMERVYNMLDIMSKELNLQIIMVSNTSDDLDLLDRYNLIELENINGVASVVNK